MFVYNPKHTAYHEAGHVIAYRDPEAEIKEVNIIPKRDTQGNLYGAGEVVPLNRSISDYSNEIIIYLAGPCAEAKWRHCDFNKCCSFAEGGDGYRVYELISAAVREKSLDTPNGKLPKSIRSAFRIYKHPAECIVNKNWKLINIIAKALLEKKTLTNEDIKIIVNDFF